MELFALAVLLTGAVWLMRRLVFRATDLAGAMGTLFVGLRHDGWPRGVQEEDRDRPWGRAEQPAPPLQSPRRPPVARVKPSVRVR